LTSNASPDAPFQQELIMSDNLFSAVLTFSLLAAGTAAVGSEMLGGHRPAAKVAAAATLPPVTVIGKRVVAADAALDAATVTLPMVMVTGCRHATDATEVAVDDTDTGRRVQ
jgi:hypothetical protein